MGIRSKGIGGTFIGTRSSMSTSIAWELCRWLSLAAAWRDSATVKGGMSPNSLTAKRKQYCQSFFPLTITSNSNPTKVVQRSFQLNEMWGRNKSAVISKRAMRPCANANEHDLFSLNHEYCACELSAMRLFVSSVTTMQLITCSFDESSYRRSSQDSHSLLWGTSRGGHNILKRCKRNMCVYSLLVI